MNIHNPARYIGESREDYADRRKRARHAVNAVTAKGAGGGFNSRQRFRDSMRESGTMGKRTRAYVALMAAWASKRVTKAAYRDEHGAYTTVGSVYEYVGVEPTSRDHVIGGVFAGSESGEQSSFTGRRIWLAGISAQRGY